MVEPLHYLLAILLFKGIIMIYMDLFIISGLIVAIGYGGVLWIRAKYLGY